MSGNPPGQPSADADRAQVDADSGGCTRGAVLLARARNYPRLRRHLGNAEAGQIASLMAARLTSLLAPDTCAVAARDTIELTLSGVSVADLETALAAISQAFAEPFATKGGDVLVDLALGGAVAERIAASDLQLLEAAEEALADAVRSGAPAVRLLDDRPTPFDRIELSRDLLTAMRDSELLLHYQPKVRLRQRQIASVEALLRWQHPVRGLVSPADFIPLAEETGDIAALTLWTIRRVIGDQRVVAANGHDLTIYVNIAGVLLGDEEFVTRACALVSESGASIGFEITETSVIRDPDVAIANLNRFAAIGIPIAIDDYGAGLSSLAYLKRLPARELKIDKLFVTQLASSNRDPLIVRSTIDLAHALEMEVVAEGVETPASMALLSVMGCDMAQGYLISRPVGLTALLSFLDAHRDGWVGESPASPFPAILRRA